MFSKIGFNHFEIEHFDTFWVCQHEPSSLVLFFIAVIVIIGYLVIKYDFKPANLWFGHDGIPGAHEGIQEMH